MREEEEGTSECEPQPIKPYSLLKSRMGYVAVRGVGGKWR